MDILVITTGGTIGALPYHDPIHPPRACTLPKDGRDVVHDVIRVVFPQFKTKVISLFLLDSDAIDLVCREKIIETIRTAPQRNILITHGTDSLIKTADYIHALQQTDDVLKQKRIILTGAMMPLANGVASDGFQNLYHALQLLSADNDEISPLNLVLCDFDAEGQWRPWTYPFTPNKYEKVYAPDGRYNRLFER